MMPNKTWQRVSFENAADKTPVAIDFCLPNLLAGSVGTVAAEAGIGKTSLLLQLGVAVAAGIPVAHEALPAPNMTGKVVFLAAEDPPQILERRIHFMMKSLVAHGYDNDVIKKIETQFHLFALLGDTPKIVPVNESTPRAWGRLENMAAGARLLILDPIRRFQILSDIAGRCKCTILFSHHVNRGSIGGQVEAGRRRSDATEGLRAFVNPTRWVLNMHTMSPEDADAHGVGSDSMRDYVRVSIPKSNYGPPLESFWLRRSTKFEGIFESVSLSAQQRKQT
jgi:RecA-family ATPase